MADVKEVHKWAARVQRPTLVDVKTWRGFRYKLEKYLMSAIEKSVELLREVESKAVAELLFGAKESSKLITRAFPSEKTSRPN